MRDFRSDLNKDHIIPKQALHLPMRNSHTPSFVNDRQERQKQSWH